MRFRLLGPLEVCGDDGEPIPLPQRRRRELLAAFLLHANEPLSGEALIDAVWGADRPGSAGGALRTHVWALRRLPGLDGRLRSRNGGYLFEVRPGELDAEEFARRCGEARASLAAGRPPEAVGVLEEALRMWREPPLEDVPATPALAGRTERLHAQRRAAQDLLIETELDLGRYRQLIPRIRELVAADPTHEHRWAQLMLALCRSGRRAEALAAYGQAHSILTEEIGLEPGTELRRLHRMVLAEAPELDMLPLLASGALDQGPARIVPDQIPPEPTDFVGREAETSTLQDALTSARSGAGVPIALIRGRPGVGKSSLAAHVAHSLRPLFPDGLLYVELGAAKAPPDVAAALEDVLRGLGVPPSAIPVGAAGRAGLLRSRLAGRRVLMVIDDAGESEQVLPFLPGTAGSAVLVTSRARLAWLPGARTVRLDVLKRAEAFALLRHMVGPERVDREPEMAGRIIEACGRLPLALRIAGARMHTHERWPLSAFADLLPMGRRLDRLSAERLSVREGVASTYAMLDAAEQRLLDLVSLVGTPDLPEWVAGLLHDGPVVRTVLNGLVDQHVLRSEGVDWTGQPRYRLDELMAEYARERVGDLPPPTRASALERALGGWHRLAVLADREMMRDPYYPEPEAGGAAAAAVRTVPVPVIDRVVAEPARWFATEQANLQAIGERACAAGRYRAAAELSAHRFAFQYFTGGTGDITRSWHQIAEAATADGDLSLAAEADVRIGILRAEHGEDLAGLRLFERGLAIFEREHDHENLARSLSCVAYGRLRRKKFVSALHMAMRGLAEARRIGDRNSEYLSLSVLSAVHVRTGDGRTGMALCDQALEMARDMRRPATETFALQNLVQANIILGRFRGALEAGREGLDLVTDIGSPLGKAHFLIMLATAHWGLEDYPPAIEELDRARASFAAQRASRMEVKSLLWLAVCHQARGDRGRARAALEEALSILRPLGLQHDAALVERAIVDGGVVKMR
ncbi:AfsR/SARP family transcriptional regulator [Actinomadura fibrosa]|uniref:BTAD domain-containing putative transcriptional regulator n=1 Tax=Actinomadura fibrosa TaxID=111802 RepID=A0ABW2XWS5_9ACTN|nr:AfsR/SARP family transcriptional regulator [Actinomadura fibrosa]